MKKAICYCFGRNFIEYYDRIIQRYEIVAVTDSDSKKWGSLYQNIICISPEEAFEKNADVILIASDRPEIVSSVRNQLIEKRLLYPIESILENINSSFKITENFGFIDWRDSNENHIIAKEGCYINNLNVQFKGDFNNIVFKEDVLVREHINIRILGDRNTIIIGKGTSVCDLSLYIGEGGSIEIGEYCLLSTDITIRQTDEHPIFNLDRKRINDGKDIIIGNHVWIGQRVTLLGGFQIGEESVIGYGSISSTQFGNNCVIGGSPAKVLREDITRRNNLVGLYPIESMDDLRI